MSNLIIGAQLYSLRDKTQTYDDMLSALREIKAMGYNACQISGQSRDLTATQLRDILDQTELFCACTHIPYDDMVDNLDLVIKNHKTLGCAYPGVGALPKRYIDAGVEGYKAFSREASAIAERLREEGLTFIYHNHNFEFTHLTGKTTGMDILFEETSDALQFEIDVFWLQAAGASPYDWIEKVRGRMDIVHFKEMGYNPGLTFSMQPMGDGNMNWPKMIEACEATGVKYALIEQDNAVDTDSIACMKRSYDYLKSIGAKF